MAANAQWRPARGPARRLAAFAAAVCMLPILAPLGEYPAPAAAIPQPVLRTVLPEAVPVTARPFLPGPPEGVSRPAWNALMDFRRLRAAAGRPLGTPTSGITCPAELGACLQSFRGQVVVWHERTGARALRPEVFDLWSRRDVARLGYPVASEYPQGQARRTDFERGALVWEPRVQRVLEYNPGVDRSVVIIGDSQAGERTWLGQGVRSLGYTPVVRGAGGTGYLQGLGGTDRYEAALESGQWLLPWGNPTAVVLQGGGNDTGYSDAQIAAAAREMIRELRLTYPETKLVMVGVIGDGKGRRAAVDRVLSRVAAEENIPFIDPGDWWSRHKLKLDDGRHLSTAGHSAAAPIFARELSTALGR